MKDKNLPTISEESKDWELPDAHLEYLKNIKDPYYRHVLKEFSDVGVDFFLSHFMIHEIYRRRRYREGLTKSFADPSEVGLWPNPPKRLEESMLLLRRTSGTGQGQFLNNRHPLYMYTKRKLKKDVLEDKKKKAPEFINALKDEQLLDVEEETQNMPLPDVTMDQSYHFHLSLQESVKRIWEEEVKNYREEEITKYGLESTVKLDRYLTKVIAQNVQKQLSDVVDSTLSMRERIVGEDDSKVRESAGIQWPSILRSCEFADIPKGALERTKERLTSLFPTAMWKFPSGKKAFKYYDNRPQIQESLGKLMDQYRAEEEDPKQYYLRHYYNKKAKGKQKQEDNIATVSGYSLDNFTITELNESSLAKRSKVKKESSSQQQQEQSEESTLLSLSFLEE